jgi:serine/threonine protein kinase
MRDPAPLCTRRDLSLENVMLDGQGQCTIIDLGLCHRVPLPRRGDSRPTLMGPLPARGKPGYTVSSQTPSFPS